MNRKTVSGIMLKLLLIGILTLAFNIQLANTELKPILIPDHYPTIEEVGKKKSFVANVLLIKTHAVNGQVVISPNPVEGLIGDLVEWYVNVDVITVLPFATHVKISVGIDPVSGKNPWGMPFSRESPMIPLSILRGRWAPPEPTNTSGLFPHSVAIFYEIDPDIFMKLWEGNGTIILKRLIKVPTDYPTIQEAINAANPGDTVLVSSATYYEHVVVNKTVSLIGENRNNTIIDGNGISPGTVVTVAADNAAVRGFTIQNSGGCPEDAGIRLEGSEGSIIVSNVMRNNVRSIDLVDSVDNTVSDNIISDAGYCGIALRGSHSNTIIGNIIYSNGLLIHSFDVDSNGNTFTANTVYGSGQDYGISLHGNHNNVTDNLFSGNEIGINLGGNYNNIRGNKITSSNRYGIMLYGSGNVIYHNNFIDNARQVWTDSINTWDDGYPSGGNYWSDYNGTDLFSGPYQNVTGSDGIGDTSYVIDENNTDNYPLMSPYEYWSNPIPGDINRDMKVDYKDLFALAAAYGSKPSKPNWNPHADINEDGKVNYKDLFVLAANYGKEWEYP